MPGTPTPTPSPMPSPLLIEVAGGEAAPWWGVPLIAGAFLLIGGFLTYLYSRNSDNRKAQREQEAQLHDSIVEAGLAMIAAGSDVRTFALRMLRRKPLEVMVEIAKEGIPLTERLSSAARHFNITMPPEYKQDYDGYLMASLMLLTPPFQRPGQELMLNKQTEHERSLINRLRALRRLKPLVYDKPADFGSIHGEAMAAYGIASDLEAERIMNEREKAKSAPNESAPSTDQQ